LRQQANETGEPVMTISSHFVFFVFGRAFILIYFLRGRVEIGKNEPWWGFFGNFFPTQE